MPIEAPKWPSTPEQLRAKLVPGLCLTHGSRKFVVTVCDKDWLVLQADYTLCWNWVNIHWIEIGEHGFAVGDGNERVEFYWEEHP
jgi:hypothetical protein